MVKERMDNKSEDRPKQLKKQDEKKSQAPNEKRVDKWYNKTIIPVLLWKNSDEDTTVTWKRIDFYA